MSEPLRITCNNVAEIPPVNELRHLATTDQHVVLQFPLEMEGVEFDKRPIIDALIPQLLDYSVFDSGQRDDQTLITIKKVIDEATILRNASAFKEAIDRFLSLADHLLAKLAQRHEISVEDLENFIFSKEFATSTGMLDDVWSYFFHGRECRFRNKVTGQVIDITLQQMEDPYMRVDPYFFGEYVQTSSSEMEVASFINDSFHDSLRILDVLSTNNYL